MMSNLAQIAQIVKGHNPQQIVLQMMQNQNMIDPSINRLIQDVETGNQTDFINFANSLFQARGLDLNQEYHDFMSLLQ